MNQTRQKTNKPKNDEYSQLLDHYEQWLEYLKQSLMFTSRYSENKDDNQSINQLEILNSMDSSNLRVMITNMDEKIPRWFNLLPDSNLDKEKLLKYIITGNELRIKLVRVKLPSLIGQIQQLFQDYNNLINQTNEKLLIEEDKVKTHLNHSINDNPLSTVLKYLSGINEVRKDEVVQLCRLADANNRLHSTNLVDISSLESWIEEIKVKFEKSSNNLECLEQRKSSLDSLLSSSTSLNGKETSTSMDIINDNSSSSILLSLPSQVSSTSSSLTQLSNSSYLSNSIHNDLNLNQILTPLDNSSPSLSNEQNPNCLSRLQIEFETKSSELRILMEKEKEAKKAWEEAQAALMAANGSLSSIKTALDSILARQQIMQEITQKRIELEKYNIEIARLTIQIFEELKNYVQNLQQKVSQDSTKKDIPLMFSQIIQSFCFKWLKLSPNEAFSRSSISSFSNSSSNSSKSNVVVFSDHNEGIQGVQGMNVIMSDSSLKESDLDPRNDVNQLSSLARIGLEMTRLWKQLNAIDSDEMWISIMQFEAIIHTRILSVVKNPSPLDRDTKHIPRYSDTTVVLYYDHLNHLTPKNHFENPMRTTVTLKALTEQQSKVFYYSTDFRTDEENDSKKTHKRARKLELLSCNNVVSPPLWALPLTHSPSYLQKLCRLSEKAHELNAIIPLDLLCEYEYIDSESNQFLLDDQSEYEEKISSRNKQDAEFILGNEVDDLLKDRKTELLSLLRADQDDLLIMRALKKSNGNNSNSLKSRSQNQNQVKLQTHPTTNQLNTSNQNQNQIENENILVKQEDRQSDPKYNYMRSKYAQELIQFVNDWQNGIINHNEIESRLQEVIGYLVHVAGSQKILAKVLNISQSALSTWLGNRSSLSVSSSVANSSRKLLMENSFESLIQKLKPNHKSKSTKSTTSIEYLTNHEYNEVENVNSNRNIHVDTSEDMEVISDTIVENIPATPLSLVTPSSFESLPPIGDLIERKSTPNDEYYMYTLTNPNGYRGATSKRPPRATKESEILRNIVQSLCNREHLTDDDVARELSEKLEPTKTVTVANWRSYRSSAAGDAKMNFCMILWIQDRRKQLLESENLALTEIEALIQKHSQHELKDGDDEMLNDIKEEVIIENSQIDSNEENEQMVENHIDNTNDNHIEKCEIEQVDEQIEKENHEQIQIQESKEENENEDNKNDNNNENNNNNNVNYDEDDEDNENLESSDNQGNSNQNTAGFLPLAILRLHVIEELSRRGITQTAASEEANLNIIGLGQPAISLLLHKTEVKPGKRGSTFRRLMQDWLNNSRLLPGELKEESVYESQLKELSVEGLVSSVNAEIKRRKIFQSRVVAEAQLNKHGYDATTFSRFMTENKSNVDPLFKTLIKEWLDNSVKQPPVDDKSRVIVPNDEDLESIGANNLNFDSLMSLTRLHTLVLKEMSKRGIKQKDILFEANVDKSSLSNFITGTKCANSIRGFQFRRKLEQWLKLSQEAHDQASDDESESMEDASTEQTLMETSSLKQSVTDEIVRRGLTRNQILEEAGLSNQGFKQLLSQVLVHGNCVSSTRGLYFREKLEQWLKESLSKSQSSIVLMNNQEKIYHLRLSLIYEFTKEELSYQNAFLEMKFDNPLIDFQFFVNYLDSIDFENIKSLFPTVELTNDFIQGIRNWIDQKYEINGSYDANGDDIDGSTGDISPRKHPKRKRVTLPESFLNLEEESDNDMDSNALNSKKTKVPSEDISELKQSKDNEKKIKTSNVDTFLGKPLIRADPFKEDFHYLKCEGCGQKVQSTAELVNCISCPYGYHPNCITPSVPLTTKDWSCSHCREIGLFDTQVLTPSNLDNIKQSPWILVWSAYHKKWRSGCVLEIHNETGYLLIRWWRNDSKWGRSNWLDMSEGKMLWKPTGIEPIIKVRQSIERKSTESTTTTTLPSYTEEVINKKQTSPSEPKPLVNLEMSTIDTFMSADSLKSAICAAGSACRAVDIVMCGTNTNVFCCMRPPGHHVGRRGFTDKCSGTGFCLLNNAAIAMLYARVRWGLKRVAVVDIDVHFGNGTSEILKGDPRAFFGCVHMIHGEKNEGFEENNQLKCCSGPSPKDSLGDRFYHGFFPHALGCTQVSENYISVGVYPESARTINSSTTSTTEIPSNSPPIRYGSSGFRSALVDVIIPQMERFDPELLIISAGFDGNKTDPLGGDLGLNASDYGWATHTLLSAISKPYASGRGRVISLMEGGYDIRKETQGLVSSVDEHVKALRKHPAI